MNMESTRKKAVAYIRISSVRQIDNESPETQRDVIEKYANANNIEILEWFYDEAKSGKNADREELQNLLSFALKYKSKIDYAIVYNMRRASRDLESYTTQVKVALKSRGITVRSATEPMVDDTKIGRFMENFLVLMGQLDNEGKAEVTVDNMKSLAMQGYWQHPPILGYDTFKILNENGKPRPSLKPNNAAEKVKKVLVRYSEGTISKAELARYASSIGLRSRYNKKLGENSINRLIKNPVYAGYISDKFTDYELVEGKHMPIISKQVYSRNQELLYSKRSRKNEVHLKHNSDYPLKGSLLCSNCRKPMYGSAPRTGNGGSSPRYHCARKACAGKTRSIKTDKVHEDFEYTLEKIQPNPGVLKLYRTVLVREMNQQLTSLGKAIERLREELNEKSTLRINAIQKFTEGSLSLEEKNDLVESLDKEKIKTSVELRELEQQQTLREADIEFAISVMTQVDKQWKESDLDIKLRFQKMLFPEGIVYDTTKRKFGTTSISELYRCATLEKGSEEPLKSHLVAQVHSNWNTICSEILRWKASLVTQTG